MSENKVVTVDYKTGAYIAKVIETSPPRTLVEIAAVLEHPQQGDLHNPYKPDVPLFHERRAAAHREKVWVLTSSVKAYEGAVPGYEESLRLAWEQMVQSLNRMKESALDPQSSGNRPDLALWADRALLNMNQLQNDYWGTR